MPNSRQRDNMTDTSKDAGVIQVLIERFERHRLPRVLELKEKVDSGELLNEMDLDYLERILEDAQEHKGLLASINRLPRKRWRTKKERRFPVRAPRRAPRNQGGGQVAK
jgi:hypothetical protein